jgi:cysteinyl-tRNA synthetase
MDDDFNTPQSLACIFELVNQANKNIDNPGVVISAKGALKDMLGILGLSLEQYKNAASLSDEEVESKVRNRNIARKNNDYALADKIRKELEEKGVILEDNKYGLTTWRRKL